MRDDAGMESKAAGGLLHTLFQRRDIEKMPARVRAVIAQQDRQSEILIGYVQVGIGLVFCSLYLIAPTPVDRMSDILAPVPVAIGLFLFLSLARLVRIRRARVSDGFVAASICIDVALIVGLIWSFHVQYGQPPAFSLKAPTFTYLFILVVVRALRFDPKYVIACGLAAALGWLLLTLAVIVSSEPNTVTRSFVAYMTGNYILIGAEFDKIFALLAVTALLALAASQAQKTLAMAISEGETAREITRFLPRGVVEDIRRAESLPEAGNAVARMAAVMMLDIRGFTSVAMSQPAADIVQVLTSLHARIIPIVRANGGVIDKFLGDGVMVSFGAVRESTTAAADAVRVLELLIGECEAWEASLSQYRLERPLVVNVAVTYGAVVFATLGNGDRLEVTVIGDAANLAAKLEKHNKVTRTRALAPVEMLAAAESQGYRLQRPIRSIPSSLVAGVPAPLNLVAWS